MDRRLDIGSAAGGDWLELGLELRGKEEEGGEVFGIEGRAPPARRTCGSGYVSDNTDEVQLFGSPISDIGHWLRAGQKPVVVTGS